ncbi:MAG TPA: anhydro-N-acetylmuramic acid kinase [Terracidiphilus sp.]|jgi:anhydro-N-acetylmuramic acid kinase
MKPRSMIVAGVMSGTSADGIDVALVNLSPARNSLLPRLKLLAHEGFRYPAVLRKAVLAAMNARSTSTAELARLNWRLGIAYADAVESTIKHHRIKIDLIGCHGQTLYHQAKPARYAGKLFACTWQAGEAAVIAAELKVPVVSNFRTADMANGGQGAPLVSLLDYAMFRNQKRSRVLQNIGGIANLTAIAAGAWGKKIFAFDTGPGNMVVDALTQKLFGKPYDRNGSIAAYGQVLEPVLTRLLRDPFFALKPPRTTGREQFGREYAAKFLAACRQVSRKPEDALATATALTTESIARSFEQFVLPKMRETPIDYIVSGGGALNRTLMKLLAARLEPLGCTLTTIDRFGVPAAAKEAAAFALMAWMTWHCLPGNVPSATGAKRPAILGQISYE